MYSGMSRYASTSAGLQPLFAHTMAISRSRRSDMIFVIVARERSFVPRLRRSANEPVFDPARVRPLVPVFRSGRHRHRQRTHEHQRIRNRTLQSTGGTGRCRSRSRRRQAGSYLCNLESVHDAKAAELEPAFIEQIGKRFAEHMRSAAKVSFTTLAFDQRMPRKTRLA
jgi:hypothetical protein